MHAQALKNEDCEEYDPDENIRLERQKDLLFEIENEYQMKIKELSFKTQFYDMLTKQSKLIEKSTIHEKESIFNQSGDKIKQLMILALNNISMNSQKIKQNQKSNQGKVTSQCKISQHLLSIQNQEGKKLQEKNIEILSQKKIHLYAKIQNCLEKEEPYRCQILLEKIEIQAKIHSKQKGIKFVQRQIQKNQGWLNQNQRKLVQELNKKQMQDKVISLLQKMKEIMNKKINLNDHIYNNFSPKDQMNQSNLSQINKIKAFPEKILNDYEQNLKYLEELKLIEKQRLVRQRQIEKSSTFEQKINENKELMKQLDILEAHKFQIKKYNALDYKINKMLLKK